MNDKDGIYYASDNNSWMAPHKISSTNLYNPSNVIKSSYGALDARSFSYNYTDDIKERIMEDMKKDRVISISDLLSGEALKEDVDIVINYLRNILEQVTEDPDGVIQRSVEIDKLRKENQELQNKVERQEESIRALSNRINSLSRYINDLYRKDSNSNISYRGGDYKVRGSGTTTTLGMDDILGTTY